MIRIWQGRVSFDEATLEKDINSTSSFSSITEMVLFPLSSSTVFQLHLSITLVTVALFSGVD